jgi:hypothetical protein
MELACGANRGRGPSRLCETLGRVERPKVRKDRVRTKITKPRRGRADDLAIPFLLGRQVVGRAMGNACGARSVRRFFVPS